MSIDNARIDLHVHIGSLGRLDELSRYVSLLELDGIGLLSLPTAGGGETGNETVNFNPEVLASIYALRSKSDGAAPFVHGFGSLDNRALLYGNESAWDPVAQVRALVNAGFSAIKMWEGKPDLQSALKITLDDSRLISAFREAATLGMPVLIHVADPPVFWERGDGPYDYVERDVPSFESLIRQTESLCRACRETTFIFPHLLFLAGDIDLMASFLDRHPHAYLDLAPGNYLYPALSAAETPTRPSSERSYAHARDFFSTYRKRIILGSDAFFFPHDFSLFPGVSLADNIERLARLERFLRGTDYFGSPYTLPGAPPLVRGLGLDPEVVSAIAHENARRLFEEAPARSSDRLSPRHASPQRLAVQRDAALSWLDSWAPPLETTATTATTAAGENEKEAWRESRRFRVESAKSIISGGGVE